MFPRCSHHLQHHRGNRLAHQHGAILKINHAVERDAVGVRRKVDVDLNDGLVEATLLTFFSLELLKQLGLGRSLALLGDLGGCLGPQFLDPVLADDRGVDHDLRT